MKKTSKKPRVSADRLTPFQKEFFACIAQYQEANGTELSGRAFGRLLGRSSNHFNLMVNTGFVPSGDSIQEMVQKLGFGPDTEERLMKAAILTKAGQRGRDNFWLNAAGRMMEAGKAEAALLRQFLRSQGLETRFEVWASRKR